MKLLFAVLIPMFAFQICFGQEFDSERNWYRDIKGYDDGNTSYDFRFYTEEDVAKAKSKFNAIKRLLPKDEWEGVYTSNTELGTSELHWSANGGFVAYYFYHTLSGLDFGVVLNEADSVKLVSEKSLFYKRKSKLSNNLIKVKIGEKHFLVPENRLQDFVDKAVGRNTSLSDFGYYRIKLDDLEEEPRGLPVLPEKYKRYLRQPIETEILEAVSRIIHQDKLDDGTINYEEVHRFVKLKAGRKKGIKTGMNFFVEDLGEWIEITKVSLNSSVGKIRRGLDADKLEQCYNEEGGSGNTIPCKNIRVGMKAKTRSSV